MNELDYWTTKRDALIRDGVCILENILDAAMLEKVRSIAANQIAQLSDDHCHEQKSTGSMVPNRDMPERVDLIMWPKTLEALHNWGMTTSNFHELI